MKLFIEDATSTIVMEIEGVKDVHDFFKRNGYEVLIPDLLELEMHVKLKKACEYASKRK